MLVGVGALAVITLRLPGDLSVWRLAHDLVPGAASLRAVARVGMAAMYPAAVGLAVFLDRSRIGRGWLVVGLSALVMAEQIHLPVVYDKRQAERRVATIAAQVPTDAEAFLLVSATRQRRYHPHDDAAWVAFASGVPTINGRYGSRPRGWAFGKVELTDSDTARDLRRSLRVWIEGHGLDAGRVSWLVAPPDEEPWAPVGRLERWPPGTTNLPSPHKDALVGFAAHPSPNVGVDSPVPQTYRRPARSL
jgi:hypothetical protein